MEELRVSTITAILRLSTDINLKKIYNDIPITSYIPFIEYGETNETKGFSKKLLKKKRKKKQRRIFYNQATLHIFHDNKIMNVKLFNNAKLQMTGILIRILIRYNSITLVLPTMNKWKRYMFFGHLFSYTKYNGNAQPLYRKGSLCIF